MGTVERLVPDGLWELFRRVVPPAPVRPQGGGRRRYQDREVLAAIMPTCMTARPWSPSSAVSRPSARGEARVAAGPPSSTPTKGATSPTCGNGSARGTSHPASPAGASNPHNGGAPPLDRRAHHGLAFRLPPVAPPLRAQSRPLPCLHQHRLHSHLRPPTRQLRQLLNPGRGGGGPGPGQSRDGAGLTGPGRRGREPARARAERRPGCLRPPPPAASPCTGCRHTSGTDRTSRRVRSRTRHTAPAPRAA